MDRQPSREVARLAGGLGSGRGSNDEENSTVIVIVGALSSLSSSSLSSILSSSSTFRRVFVEVGVLKVAASQERGSMHEKKCAACSATVRSVACSLRAVSRFACAQFCIETLFERQFALPKGWPQAEAETTKKTLPWSLS